MTTSNPRKALKDMLKTDGALRALYHLAWLDGAAGIKHPERVNDVRLEIESAIQEARKETETRVIDEVIEAASTKPFKDWKTMDVLRFFDIVGHMYRAPKDSLTNPDTSEGKK